MFEMNEKKQENGIYGLLIYILVMYLLSSLIAIIFRNYYLTFVPFESINERFQAVCNLVCYIFLVIPLVYVFLYELKDDLKSFFKNILKYLGSIIIGYFVLIIFSNVAQIILDLLKAAPAQNQEAIEGILHGGYLLPMAIMTVILAPIAEELVFRKSIFSLFKNDYLALAVSSIFFGLIHVLQGDFINIISYASSGLAFGLVYLKSDRNIWVTITLHSLSNLISVIAIMSL